jgi:alkane 1-monooxygenase
MKLTPVLSLLLLPILVPLGHLWPGPGDFLLPASCFLLHPLAGKLLPRRPAEFPEQENDIAEGPWFRIVLLAFVPILLILTAWALIVVSTQALPAVSIIGLVLSIGTLNGVLGFTVAHECIHHRQRLDRFAGHLLLFQNGYLHYAIEHLHGHHVYGCTPEDPHTARLNESLYAFIIRSVGATWKNAWRIEQRLGKKRAAHGSHRVITLCLLQLCLYGEVFLILGPLALLFLVAQALIAIFLLHAVDYLQHYGLMRQEIAAGKYERTRPMHAWATGDHIDQFNLFQLDKHADHHLHPSRHYEQLVAHDTSPQLPMGYAGMILLALYPKAWFRTVNPLIPNTENQAS